MSTTYAALSAQGTYCFHPYCVPGNQINESKITFSTLVLCSFPANSSVSVINKHDIGCTLISGFMLLKALGFLLKFWFQYFMVLTLLQSCCPTAWVSSVFQHSHNPVGDLCMHLVLAKSPPVSFWTAKLWLWQSYIANPFLSLLGCS